MRTCVVPLVLGLALSVPAALVSAKTLPAAPLEGTQWLVTLTPDVVAVEKGEKPFDDTISFKDGQVEMSECLKHGFQASPYSALTASEPWTFRTEQLSERNGKTVWIGTVVGDAVTGTMVWTKKDGAILNYSFQGNKVPPKEA